MAGWKQRIYQARLHRVHNPVYPDYFADPFVWKHDGIYYAAGTGSGVPGPHAFTLLTSPDLQQWTNVGWAMEKLDPEFGDSYWAPEVAFAGGRFWLYYSVGRGDKAHHLRVAVADRPEGPYVDTGSRLTNPFSIPFAIDASPFRDTDGQWYLYYACDFLDGERPGTAAVVDRLRSMTELEGAPRLVVRACHDWQRFLANRVMYGARYDWHTIEGPAVVHRNGRYWCLFSAGRWENESYGVDWAHAPHPLGPWTYDGVEAGARLLHTIPGRLIGPGHNSVIDDYIVYHAWDPAMTARRMHIDPLVWTAGGPRLTR